MKELGNRYITYFLGCYEMNVDIFLPFDSICKVQPSKRDTLFGGDCISLERGLEKLLAGGMSLILKYM